MRIVGSAISFCVASVLSLSSVSAQSAPNPPSTRRVSYDFARCTVDRHPGGASKAVLLNVDSLTLRTRFVVLTDSDCLSRFGQLAYPGDFFLYALAEALVPRELADVPPQDFSKVPALTPRIIAPFEKLKRKMGYDYALQVTSEADTFRPINEYGECVVRYSPVGSKALLMVEPESVDEAARFEALQPALSECAAKGLQFELSKTILRGAIALNYYRLTQSLLNLPVH